MTTILLVEDDPDIRHLVAYKLRKSGLEVIAVADGRSALRAAGASRPDLVLLDIRMPEMSGIEVCRQLRAGPLTAAVPIILLTARSRPQDLEQGYAAGATDYIIKPFSTRVLLERVEAALARVAG
jgi:two-component system, OmpR family, phosphate regulon response regulator PhoB